MRISDTTAYPMIEDRTSPKAWCAKEIKMGTTIGRFCAGLALMLSASAVSAQTPEGAGEEHFARALEARVGEVLDRSVNLAAERALALLEAREAERLDEAELAVERALAALEARELERLEEAALSTAGVVERLGAAPARELPGGTLAARPAAAVRTERLADSASCSDEAEPKASIFVRTAAPPSPEAPRGGKIPPPLELVAHEPNR
jgi:hypothetical protein